MKKNISTQSLKMHVGEVVDAVRLRGDRYIIERRGKAVAAIVPLSVNENDERQRQQFFELLRAVRNRGQKDNSEPVEEVITEEIIQTRR